MVLLELTVYSKKDFCFLSIIKIFTNICNCAKSNYFKLLRYNISILTKQIINCCYLSNVK